jgi:gluconolactonase
MEISRRTMLAGVTAAAAATLTRPTFAAWEESTRYPDPRVQILDPSFARYRVVQASVERLYTGARWSEGPVWFGDVRCLLWSDIPNNRILRWDEVTGRTSVYRQPSNNSNGLTRDRQGRLITCEHDTRRLTRTEYDGSITVLVDKFDGKPLNSPNESWSSQTTRSGSPTRPSAFWATTKVTSRPRNCRPMSTGSTRPAE